ncbi:MAG: hypothetical protein WC043_05115 [Pseudobdellovibrionaceae bacterium]
MSKTAKIIEAGEALWKGLRGAVEGFQNSRATRAEAEAVERAAKTEKLTPINNAISDLHPARLANTDDMNQHLAQFRQTVQEAGLIEATGKKARDADKALEALRNGQKITPQELTAVETKMTDAVAKYHRDLNAPPAAPAKDAGETPKTEGKAPSLLGKLAWPVTIGGIVASIGVTNITDSVGITDPAQRGNETSFVDIRGLARGTVDGYLQIVNDKSIDTQDVLPDLTEAQKQTIRDAYASGLQVAGKQVEGFSISGVFGKAGEPTIDKRNYDEFIGAFRKASAEELKKAGFDGATVENLNKVMFGHFDDKQGHLSFDKALDSRIVNGPAAPAPSN